MNNCAGRWRGGEPGYDGSIGRLASPKLQPAILATTTSSSGVLEIRHGPPATHTTWMRFKDGSRDRRSGSPAYMKDNLRL